MDMSVEHDLHGNVNGDITANGDYLRGHDFICGATFPATLHIGTSQISLRDDSFSPSALVQDKYSIDGVLTQTSSNVNDRFVGPAGNDSSMHHVADQLVAHQFPLFIRSK
jgi:hypothetical protein